jgi:hypothetical protein
MRHIATFFVLVAVFFSQPAAAQQWEPFLSPPFPMVSYKLLSIEDNIFVWGGNGLYRSQDGGEHWEEIRSYTSDNVLQVLEVNRNNNRLYWSEGLDSMSFWQLFSSADLGDTWQAVGNVKASVSAFIGDTLYGGCFDGTGLCSKLGAANWKTMPQYPKDSAGYVLGLAAEGPHLWAITEKGIYHSPDAGYTWEESLPINDIEIPSAGPTLFIKALNGEVVMTDQAKKRIYFSKDVGATWQEASWKGTGGLYDSGQHLFAGDSTGTQLWRFEGGDLANWHDLPTGATAHIGLTGVGEHDGAYWLGSNKFGVFRKKPDSNKWLSANGESVQNGFTLQYIDGHLSMFYDYYIQTFSPDNGITWQQDLRHALLGEHWQTGDYNYLVPYAGSYLQPQILRAVRNQRFEWSNYVNIPISTVTRVVNSGDTILVTGGAPYNLCRSYDNGQSWNTVPGTLGNVIIRSHKGKFYALKDNILYRTDDVGATWQPTHTFPNNMHRLHIVHDTMIVSYVPGDQIFYSTDDGQTFENLPAPQNDTTSIFNLSSNKNLLLLHMNDGVAHVSTDVGKTWLTVASPPGASMNSIASSNRWAYGDNSLFTFGYPGNYRLRLDAQRQASGKVFLDSNGNGQKDAGEEGINGLMVKAAQSGTLGATYGDGDFAMLFGQQSDELSVANVPTHYAAAPASVTVASGANSIPPVSFAIQPQGTVNDASVHLVAAAPFRAGYDNTLYVNVKNAGTIANSGQLKLALNPLLSVISTLPVADEKIGDTLIWDYVNLQPLKERKFQVDVKTAVVPPGEPVLVKAETFNGADVNMTNNVALLDGQVVSSFDPNDKAVSESHVPVNETDDEELVYTVRFQNLGNIETDFITVRDTLSESLDAASVRVLTASHLYEWHIEGGRVLVFRFNPVRLAPASEDSLRSQGFVQFAARLKPGLQVGAAIANTAHIYFDFNPAVVTNTVVTSVTVVATFEPSRRALPLEVFPNPASSRVTLRLPEGIAGAGRIEIFSAEGRLVYSAAAQGVSQEIELSGISAGAYWCRWTAEGKVFWGKVAVGR